MKILSLQELLDLQAPDIDPIISEGILYPATKMILFGKYKAWKSMLLMDLVFRLATGTPWHRFKTRKKRILVVQLEIPTFLYKDRVEKYLAGFGTQPDNIYFVSEPYLKLDKDLGMTSLRNAIKTFQPAVLVIDPLYRVLSGNISDPTVADAFQSNMDKVREEFNLAIILIAHSRQQLTTPDGLGLDFGADDIMGSSHWPNWFDTIAKITKDYEDEDRRTTDITVRFDVMRHAKGVIHPMKLKVGWDDLHWKLIV